MASGFFLGLLVVVAQGTNLVRVDVHEGQKLGTWALPGKPLALFGAPDGGIFAPLAVYDTTAFLSPQGTLAMLEGRLAPLFFREPDRFYAVFPRALTLLSYPERVPLASWPLPPELDVSFATCSWDGRVVALGIGPPKPMVVLVFPFDEGRWLKLFPPLPSGSWVLAVSQGYLAAATGPALWLAPLGLPEGVTVKLAGPAKALLWGEDGRVLFALVSGPKSQLLRCKLSRRASQPPSVSTLWQGQGQPRGLAWAGSALAVLEDQGVSLVSPKGKLLAQVPLADAEAMAVLPEQPASGQIPWSDTAKP
jgi:hypothetical protein